MNEYEQEDKKLIKLLNSVKSHLESNDNKYEYAISGNDTIACSLDEKLLTIGSETSEDGGGFWQFKDEKQIRYFIETLNSILKHNRNIQNLYAMDLLEE